MGCESAVVNESNPGPVRFVELAMITLKKQYLVAVVAVAVLSSLFATASCAADQPGAISLAPAKFELRGVRAQQQLVISGTFSAEDIRDLTTGVTYASSNANVVKIEGTLAKPVGDGTAQITATLGGLTAVAEVTVKEFAIPSPVSFKNEMLAALTKAGCNMGACHGSPSGKGGFRLSLRAFDSTIDTLTLRSEFMQRRINPVQPDESLLIKKPLMEVAHGGGRRIKKGDPVHRVFHGWIGEGLRLDADNVPDLVKMDIFPNKRVFRPAASQQQLIVTGTFSDGSTRDITPLTVFSSSNEQVASVNESGLVSKGGRGETAVLARFLDKMATSHITFLEDVPGFTWSNPAEHNFVDNLVFDKLKQLQILPSDLCTDEEFLRRAYLDVTGRLPTIEESTAFLGNQTPEKRNQLIDQLVDSDDFAEFWTLKWSDILRSNSKKITAVGTQKFRHWVYDSIRTDKPFDQFARELLTASGSVFENPAANYWRASRDPNDAVETTAQLFLGIRIQCAKCHNHPFERWSQDNYYGIAAAFTRIARQKGDTAEEEIIYPMATGEITQPRTGKQMKVHLLLKGDVDDAAGQDRREVFAQWLTTPENPFFARSAVNRIWGHLLGRGIVEPVDDFRDSNPPSNAKLLDELAAQFAKNSFSQKWVVKTILKSRTYQLSSRKNNFNKDDEIYNSHANTRLLSAEQLLDAICQVTSVPETFAGLPPGTRAVSLADPPTDHYFLKIFGQPQREMACQCERSNESNLSQALQMINGPTVHGKLRADAGRIAIFVKENKPDDEVITTLYLAALSRKPTQAELDAAKRHIAAQQDRRLALEDVGWAILNSKEFLFQH